ncbi:hypothetical protein BJ170DRAFT_317001 [Xylariales sp. AK1849]|nr:hypothetical protein BJ170DRAFT_317001 [Xylariales sp. AK1849]
MDNDNSSTADTSSQDTAQGTTQNATPHITQSSDSVQIVGNKRGSLDMPESEMGPAKRRLKAISDGHFRNGSNSKPDLSEARRRPSNPPEVSQKSYQELLEENEQFRKRLAGSIVAQKKLTERNARLTEQNLQFQTQLDDSTRNVRKLTHSNFLLSNKTHLLESENHYFRSSIQIEKHRTSRERTLKDILQKQQIRLRRDLIVARFVGGRVLSAFRARSNALSEVIALNQDCAAKNLRYSAILARSQERFQILLGRYKDVYAEIAGYKEFCTELVGQCKGYEVDLQMLRDEIRGLTEDLRLSQERSLINLHRVARYLPWQYRRLFLQVDYEVRVRGLIDLEREAEEEQDGESHHDFPLSLED